MGVSELVRVPEDKAWANDVNRVVDVLLGNDGSQVKNVGWDGSLRDPNTGAVLSTGNYSQVTWNSGGNHEVWRNSTDSANVATMTDAGLSVTDITIGGDLLVPGDLTVNGNTTLGNAIGDTTAISGPTTIGGTLDVTGTTTLTGDLNVGGTTVFGNSDVDPHLVIGVTVFRNLAATTVQAYIDSGNNRVIIGSSTPMGSDTTPNLQVAGRLYVGPDSANDNAILIARSAASTNRVRLGLNASNALLIKDITDTEIVKVDGSGLTVTGDIVVSDDLDVTGDVTISSGLTVDSPTFVVDSAGSTVGFGTNSPDTAVVAHFNGRIRLDGTSVAGKAASGQFFPININGGTWYFELYS